MSTTNANTLSNNLNKFDNPDEFYIGKKNIIYILPNFNSTIDPNLLEKYNILIFANFTGLAHIIGKNNYIYENQLESKFNKPIDLPNSLESITFGLEFNQPVKLPNSLKILIFGEYFNCMLELPDSLIVLDMELTMRFNYPIKLNDSLKILFFSGGFNQQISFPENLEILSFGYNFNQNILLPEKLKKLIIHESFSKYIDLPNTLNYLKINISHYCNCGHIFNPNDELSEFYQRLFDNLPNSLEKLIIDGGINHIKINNLPNNLKTIIFRLNTVKLILPDSIESVGLVGLTGLTGTNVNNLIKSNYLESYLNRFGNFPTKLKYIYCDSNISDQCLHQYNFTIRNIYNYKLDELEFNRFDEYLKYLDKK